MAKQNESPETYKEVIVKRNKLNLYTMHFTKNGVIQKLRILPGINRITDQEIVKCIEDKDCNKAWVAMLESGVHEIVTGISKGTKREKAFTAMDVSTCKKIVAETFSIPELELMYADEEKHKQRKVVLDAIMAQIDVMKSEEAGKH